MVDMIFQGALDPTLPPVSSKIVRIFTSSTFTGKYYIVFCYVMMFNDVENLHKDTTMERNTLMAKCYPRIKDYCREKHGLEFQVSDFRSFFSVPLNLHASGFRVIQL